MLKPWKSAVVRMCVLASLLLITLSASSVETTDAFTKAIRANNLQALQNLARGPDAVSVADKLHSTPLHYAALYGSAEAVRILLSAGANPNAKNDQGVTPLVYAAYDFQKTKMLVEKEATVNGSGTMGVTALMMAASVPGNAATVRYLLAKGAQVGTVDGVGSDALMRAAGMSDVEVVRLLLEKGGDPKRANRFGGTALEEAAGLPDLERVQLLLARGADPNTANSFGGKVKNGPIALTHLTPLMLASTYGSLEVIQALLNAGAKVNEVDGRKMSPLMLAVATDRANPATVRKLMLAGADVNAKDQNGESVLDWARKFRQPEILSSLEHAGAKGGETVEPPERPIQAHISSASEAVARSLPLLIKSGPQFFREGGGCNGCHHQPIYGRVYTAVTSAGGQRDGNQQQVNILQQGIRDAMIAERPRTMGLSTLLINTGGAYDPALAQLNALAEMHEPANMITDTLLQYIALQQSSSGAWVSAGIARPPIEESDISRTALAIRALREYEWPARRAEFEGRIARAREWLQKAHPITAYERADRLMGLRCAGVPTSTLRPDVEELLQRQREDGGWSQTPYLASDAYATGLVLHTLYANSFLQADDIAYRKGVAFLLHTQFPDGSWYVRSRAPKFQPYFQSGFPFEHDQWISSTATAWATMALAHAMQHEKQPAVVALSR